MQVAREGTKKTVFTNFLELCKTMNRQLEHVQAFLLAELGTSGNLDGQSRLVVKGRFLPKAFEGVLRRYVNECVLSANWQIPHPRFSYAPCSRPVVHSQCGL
jgi:translation initiation factor 2 subunit 2